MLSFWETESFVNYDVVIIGAGITGLSSAISILEKRSDVQVLILEKSIFPSGASTKNAGFACFGSISELREDIDSMGETKMVDLVRDRWQGLQKLRSRCSDQELGFESFGGYDLLDKSDGLETEIKRMNELLYPVFEHEVYSDSTRKIHDFGFNSRSFSRMVFTPLEGQIHTGKTISALWKLASKLGARIITGAPVVRIQNNEVITQKGDGQISFFGRKVVVCTNAFTRELLPDIDLKPGRGQVLITQPIPELKFKGTFHMNSGFYYFRNVGDRVLFGGGRQLDMKTEETTVQGINPKIEHELHRILRNDLLPDTPFEIDQKWSGIMAFGSEKWPIIRWINSSILVAVRLSGMGMALGSSIGERVAEEVISNLD
jgi:glycine/D-amino acid oxidase-like deaminating enzyme